MSNFGFPAWAPPAAFAALLAAVALAWLPTMRHPTYIRETLLVGLAAPAVAALGLLLIGPTRSGLAAALAGWPARLFLAAVWGHALLAWASLAWTSSPEATMPRAAELSALALWATGWLLASAGAGAWRGLAVGHLCVGGLIAFVGAGYWTWLKLKGHAPPRLGVPIGNPNTVAVLMLFPIAGAASLLAGPAFRWRSWRLPGGALAAALVLALTAFALAGSRSGLVGLGVVAVVLAALKLRPRFRWLLLGGALVAVVLGAFLLAGDPARRARAIEGAKIGSLSARYYGIAASWQIFEERPASGSGAGTFLREAQSRIQPENYLSEYRGSVLNLAHNEYAQTAAELGIPGLALLFIVLGAAAWGAARAAGAGPPKGAAAPDDDEETSRALAAGLSAAVCGVAVSSLADPSLRFWDFTGFFYAAAALAAGAARPDAPAEPAPAPAGAGRRIGVAAAVALVAIAASALWAWPDGVRECRLLAGHRALGNGDFETACRELAAAANSRGDYSARIAAHREWIEALRLGRRLPEAVAEADFLALRRLPECPILLRRLAVCRLSEEDRSGAIEALVMAGRRDPFASEGRELLTRSFRNEPAGRRIELAEATARRLALPPAERAALRSLAAAAGADFPAAAEAIRNLEADQVAWLPLELWRGTCLYSAGRKEEAITALRRHTDLVPLHAEGWRTLAGILNEFRGDAAREEIIGALRRCIRIEPEDDYSRVGLALNLLAAGRPREVEGVLLPRLERTPRAADLALILAEAYMAAGRPDRAREVLSRTWKRTRNAELQQAIEKLDAVPKGQSDQR